jgi:hypothetical protein
LIEASAAWERTVSLCQGVISDGGDEARDRGDLVASGRIDCNDEAEVVFRERESWIDAKLEA